MDSSQTAHERCAQIAWLPSLQRKRDGSRSRVRQVTRQEMTLQQRKRKTSGQEQGEKARRDVLDQVSCARDLTGLVTVLHIMVERASVLTHLERDTRTLHRFDRLTWKATSTRITCAGALQSRFHPCRILPVLTSTESSFSILEPQCPREVLICCREFKKCTRRLVSDFPRIPCHHFVFPSRTEERTCRQVFCLYRICLGKSYFTFEC